MLLYKSLLLPLLTYGVSLWGNGYKGTLHRAEVIQNDAIRAIFGIRRRDSVARLAEELDLPPLSTIVTVHTALLAYKMSKGLVPSDIAFPITPVAKRTARRATSFQTPFSAKQSSRHALAYLLPTVWSSLPRDIRSITSAKKFVNEVKKIAKKQ